MRSFAPVTIALALSVLYVNSSSLARAQSASVPASLQAELIAKLAAYDRSFAKRAGNTARVLVVMRPGSAKSELSSNEIKSALGRLDQIGGLPHQQTVVAYSGAAELAQRCRAERIAIVFVAAGLEDAIEAIAGALSGLSVMSVGALSSYVAKGIVLGFDLENGKPKLIVNLEQARRQNVDLSSNVLRLMRVYR